MNPSGQVISRLLLLLQTAICTWLLANSAQSQQVSINLGTLPNGQPTPANGIVSNEWQSQGILLAARRATETVGAQGSISPFIGGSGHGPSGRYYFFTPDVYGAVGIFRFLIPGTTVPTDATFFEMWADFNPGESVSLRGFDANGTEVARQDQASPGNASVAVQIQGRFRFVEVRTVGNPGIGFNYGRPLRFHLLYSSYGNGCPGSGAVVPTLLGTGSVSGNTLDLRIDDGPTGALSIVAMSLAPGSTPILGCTWLQSQVVGNSPALPLTIAGTYDLTVAYPGNLVPLDVFFQAFILDSGAPNGLFSATAGLCVAPR